MCKLMVFGSMGEEPPRLRTWRWEACRGSGSCQPRASPLGFLPTLRQCPEARKAT